jgi:hypothetical protein
MLQWLYTCVVNVCPQCFICFFRHMLQVYLYGSCICFTHMLQMFLSRCCVRVANVFRCFCKCFRCMFQIFYLFFRCMLYLLHLDVSKLDRVLNLSPSPFCCFASVKRGKAAAVPTGMGGPHVLASGRSRRDVGG